MVDLRLLILTIPYYRDNDDDDDDDDDVHTKHRAKN